MLQEGGVVSLAPHDVLSAVNTLVSRSIRVYLVRPALEAPLPGGVPEDVGPGVVVSPLQLALTNGWETVRQFGSYLSVVVAVQTTASSLLGHHPGELERLL